ncbi:uncharacterized protein ALTATR162_LOCUS32 [Alternaria atra]|uniref:Isochorismatase-like domain-containing protein n=1 Tax=Alternaria atra TaxID=119953 RepID=A0A8J2HUR4_9PLEO|nr:uncharacterized protein ALTATR162_LOCUS32 [Alternaria atra]CAG5137044.1 unnamed protein product [Alternaria atra]
MKFCYTIALAALTLLNTVRGDAVPWERIDKDDALLLILDLQVGLFQLARDWDPTLYKQNIMAHAEIGKVFDIPVILSTSADQGPNGPLPKEMLEMYPDAPLIRRQGEVNAWDNEDFKAAIRAANKTQIIVGGITTDVCTTFLALSLRAEGYSVFANVEASGTYTELVRDTANARMQQAGVQLVSLFSIVCDLMRDWRNTPGAKELLPYLDKYLPNHELDFGVPHFQKLAEKCNFPWLCANVLDPALGKDVPLGRCKKTALVNINGVKIGLVGLVEQEWLATVNVLPPNLIFRSASATAEALVPVLKDQGADIIIELTHQRKPNDIKLAQECADLIDLLLAGHPVVARKVALLRFGTGDDGYKKAALHVGVVQPTELSFKPTFRAFISFKTISPTFKGVTIMPLWLIFHPDGTFVDDTSKELLAADITKIYTSVGLPAFYVVTNFIKMPENTILIGGKIISKEKPFIRVVIEHIAVTLPNEDEAYKKVANAVDAALKPHIADKGFDWEFHIDETERRLWKINGMFPPAFKSEGEKIWREENRPVPLEKGSL